MTVATNEGVAIVVVLLVVDEVVEDVVLEVVDEVVLEVIAAVVTVVIPPGRDVENFVTTLPSAIALIPVSSSV